MKAMVMTQFGDQDVFKEMNLSIPETIPGHVLIKVKGTSVNPLDFKLRKGVFPDLIKNFPAVLHGDVSGVIEKVGQGVRRFSVGDEIYGCVGGFLNMQGTLAEYVLADENLIAHKPKSLSFLEAAALPLVSLTAWEGLITYANVQKNDTVLIHGGTGGVGHIAIQIAKYLNAKVYATSSSEQKMKITKQLGADFSINYKNHALQSYRNEHTENTGFDVVFDTVGGDNLNLCFDAAALYGRVISILAAGNYDLTPAFMKGLSIHTVFQPLPLLTGKNRDQYGQILTKVAELVDQDIIKPLIDQNEFTIHQVGKAHAHLENGNAIGKVVVSCF